MMVTLEDHQTRLLGALNRHDPHIFDAIHAAS